MPRYKYRAVNQKGRPIQGTISANSEVDLYNQLLTAGLELIDCQSAEKSQRSSISLRVEKIKVSDLIQLFVQLEQLQSAGVPMLDALSDVRDTTGNGRLRDMMSDISKDVSEGLALSEAMARHPKVFHNLYTSLIGAGENTGDISFSYRQLIKYLKWVDTMQSKIKKATRYPMIVSFAMLVMLVVMMGFVVPQIVDFIKNLGQELPLYTIALINTSEFFQSYWWVVLFGPLGLFFGVKLLRKLSDDFAYRWDVMLLGLPMIGDMIRKISIARYAQTFGALYSSGIDVVSALNSAKDTVSNLALLEALDSVESHVKAGSALSEAFGRSGEFPSLVTRMIKIGEESGNLTPVLDQVAEFYTKEVDEAVEGLIAMIEPGLTALMGVMILWIAVAVFGPIYSSFENLEI